MKLSLRNRRRFAPFRGLNLVALLALPPLAALFSGCGTYAPGSSNFKRYASTTGNEYSSGVSSATAEPDFKCGETDNLGYYSPNVQSYPEAPELDYTACKGVKDPAAIEFHGTPRTHALCVFPAVSAAGSPYPLPYRSLSQGNAPYYRCIAITDTTKTLRTAFPEEIFKDMDSVYLVDEPPGSEDFNKVHTCLKQGTPGACAGYFAFGKYR